ncbi:MAG TPA: hypothetical protein VIJ35_08760, partial [Bradyrhizobium sp.]
LGWQRLREIPVTLLAQPARSAQFYYACAVPFSPPATKIRGYGLQFLHSSPDILDLDLALSALLAMPFRGRSAQALTKFP